MSYKVTCPEIYCRKNGNFGEELLTLYVFDVYWGLSPVWGVLVFIKVYTGMVVPAWLRKPQRPRQVN